MITSNLSFADELDAHDLGLHFPATAPAAENSLHRARANNFLPHIERVENDLTKATKKRGRSGSLGNNKRKKNATGTTTPADIVEFETRNVAGQMMVRDRKTRLANLEAVIREHLGTGKFFLVAAALREIDDERLYLPDRSIYTYAKNKFAFSRRTTNTYLCSASVYESLVEDSTLPVPVNISHIRSLHKFPADVRRYIWKQVCESGQTITEEHVVAMTVKYETGIAFTDLNNELYTPKDLIMSAKHVISGLRFDLDPASCHFANNLHDNRLAEHIYDEASDGLKHPWHGHVWVSPPQGTEIDGSSKQSKWFLTTEKKFLDGEITSAMCLLKVDFGHNWFLRVLGYPHCLFHSKLNFSTPTGREKTLQDESFVLVYLGHNVNAFCSQFGKMGTIPGYNSWSYRPVGAQASEASVTNGMSKKPPLNIQAHTADPDVEHLSDPPTPSLPPRANHAGAGTGMSTLVSPAGRKIKQPQSMARRLSNSSTSSSEVPSPSPRPKRSGKKSKKTAPTAPVPAPVAVPTPEPMSAPQPKHTIRHAHLSSLPVIPGYTPVIVTSSGQIAPTQRSTATASNQFFMAPTYSAPANSRTHSQSTSHCENRHQDMPFLQAYYMSHQASTVNEQQKEHQQKLYHRQVQQYHHQRMVPVTQVTHQHDMSWSQPSELVQAHTQLQPDTGDASIMNKRASVSPRGYKATDMPNGFQSTQRHIACNREDNHTNDMQQQHSADSFSDIFPSYASSSQPPSSTVSSLFDDLSTMQLRMTNSQYDDLMLNMNLEPNMNVNISTISAESSSPAAGSDGAYVSSSTFRSSPECGQQSSQEGQSGGTPLIMAESSILGNDEPLAHLNLELGLGLDLVNGTDFVSGNQ
ncbi:hypothetical protein HDU85_006449 [Gaertneriomyces sp. JEL0708]|nr:hypothetical protein HDU85_006449 [Gaertneriomyces sp. JEL0708]